MSNINLLSANLRRNLQHQLILARKLIRLSQEQTRALVSNDIVQIAVLETTVRESLSQQEGLEETRLQCTLEIAKALGLPPEATLVQVLPKLPPSDQRVLRQQRQEILKAHHELRALKEQNLHLLQNALDYVQFSLEAISSVAFKPSKYGTNLAALSSPSLLLDSRA